MDVEVKVKEEVTVEEHEVELHPQNKQFPDNTEMCFVDVNCLTYPQLTNSEDASDPLQFEEGLAQNTKEVDGSILMDMGSNIVNTGTLKTLWLPHTGQKNSETFSLNEHVHEGEKLKISLTRETNTYLITRPCIHTEEGPENIQVQANLVDKNFMLNKGSPEELNFKFPQNKDPKPSLALWPRLEEGTEIGLQEVNLASKMFTIDQTHKEKQPIKLITATINKPQTCHAILSRLKTKKTSKMLSSQDKRARAYVLIHSKNDEQTLKSLQDKGQKMVVALMPQMQIGKSFETQASYHTFAQTCPVEQKSTPQKLPTSTKIHTNHDGFGQVSLQSVFTKLDTIKENSVVQKIAETNLKNTSQTRKEPQNKPSPEPHEDSHNFKQASKQLHDMTYLHLQGQGKEQRLTTFKIPQDLQAQSCDVRSTKTGEHKFQQTENNLAYMDKQNSLEKTAGIKVGNTVDVLFQAQQLNNKDIERGSNTGERVFKQPKLADVLSNEENMAMQKSSRIIPSMIQKEQQQLAMPLILSQSLIQKDEQPKLHQQILDQKHVINLKNENSEVMMQRSRTDSQSVTQKIIDMPYALDSPMITNSNGGEMEIRLDEPLQTDVQIMQKGNYLYRSGGDLQQENQAELHILDTPSLFVQNIEVTHSENQPVKDRQQPTHTEDDLQKSKQRNVEMIQITEQELPTDKVLNTVHVTQNLNPLIPTARIQSEVGSDLTKEQSNHTPTELVSQTESDVLSMNISNSSLATKTSMRTKEHFNESRLTLDMKKLANTPLSIALNLIQLPGAIDPLSQTKTSILHTKQYPIYQGQRTSVNAFMKNNSNVMQRLESNADKNHNTKTKEWRQQQSQHSIGSDGDKYFKMRMKSEKKIPEGAMQPSQNSTREISLLRRLCWLKKQQEKVKRHILGAWSKDIDSIHRVTNTTSTAEACTSKLGHKDKLSKPIVASVVNKTIEEKNPQSSYTFSREVFHNSASQHNNVLSSQKLQNTPGQHVAPVTSLNNRNEYQQSTQYLTNYDMLDTHRFNDDFSKCKSSQKLQYTSGQHVAPVTSLNNRNEYQQSTQYLTNYDMLDTHRFNDDFSICKSSQKLQYTSGQHVAPVTSLNNRNEYQQSTQYLTNSDMLDTHRFNDVFSKCKSSQKLQITSGQHVAPVTSLNNRNEYQQSTQHLTNSDMLDTHRFNDDFSKCKSSQKLQITSGQHVAPVTSLNNRNEYQQSTQHLTNSDMLDTHRFNDDFSKCKSSQKLQNTSGQHVAPVTSLNNRNEYQQSTQYLTNSDMLDTHRFNDDFSKCKSSQKLQNTSGQHVAPVTSLNNRNEYQQNTQYLTNYDMLDTHRFNDDFSKCKSSQKLQNTSGQHVAPVTSLNNRNEYQQSTQHLTNSDMLDTHRFNDDFSKCKSSQTLQNTSGQHVAPVTSLNNRNEYQQSTQYLTNSDMLDTHRFNDAFSKCKVCGQTFEDVISFNFHRATAHTNEDWSHCLHCGMFFKDKHQVELHQKGCLGYITIIHYPCNMCGALFNDPLSLAFHAASHNQVPKCLKCDMQFENQKLLDIHKKMCHYNCTIPCNTCNKKFSDLKSCASHMTTHTDILNNCEWCGGKLSADINLERHILGFCGTQKRPRE